MKNVAAARSKSLKSWKFGIKSRFLKIPRLKSRIFQK